MRLFDNGIYRDATPEEVKQYEAMSRNPQIEIEQCKSLLSLSDYKAIKYAEGEISAEEYEPIRLERRALRIRINELEQEIGL